MNLPRLVLLFLCAALATRTHAAGATHAGHAAGAVLKKQVMTGNQGQLREPNAKRSAKPQPAAGASGIKSSGAKPNAQPKPSKA